jgi:hypothetical protein
LEIRYACGTGRAVSHERHHPELTVLMTSMAQIYAVSRATLYRLLRGERQAPEGGVTKRAVLNKSSGDPMERLKDGDRLVVWKIDRLGSTRLRPIFID